jgi:hypothetical protein
MQQSCTYGSVRGASGNRCPYRDKMALEQNLAFSLCLFPELRLIYGERNVGESWLQRVFAITRSTILPGPTLIQRLGI